MNTESNNENYKERENILMVLGEFSEEYKTNSRQITDLITAVHSCSEQVQGLVEKGNNLQSDTVTIQTIPFRELLNDTVTQIKNSVQQIAIVKEPLNKLSEKITENTFLLKNPSTQKIIHHHHASKLIWAVAGLILLLILCCTGWYLTAAKLDAYAANDTKYRYMKQKGNPELVKMLYYLDSLQFSKYHMKDSVVVWENQEQQAFELSRKLQIESVQGQQLKGELKALENQRKKRKGEK